MGADPLRPAWCHLTEGPSLRASPEYVQLFPVLGSPNPRFPPYAVGPFHVHGAPAYGRYKPEDHGSKRRRASRGDLGSLNDHQPEPIRISWAVVAARKAKGQPKRHNRIQRRRSPNVTHSVVWETRVRKTIEIIVYFAHRANTRKLLKKRNAPNVTHSVVSWAWAALSASCCNKSVACFATSPKRCPTTTT